MHGEFGRILHVTEPTPWCTVMVVVPKASGAVQICVDMKPLHKHLLRQVNSMPKVAGKTN